MQPQTNLKIPRVRKFQQMIYLLIFQNNLTINIANTEGPIFRVDDRI